MSGLRTMTMMTTIDVEHLGPEACRWLVSGHVTCDGSGPFRQLNLKKGTLKEQSETEYPDWRSWEKQAEIQSVSPLFVIGQAAPRRFIDAVVPFILDERLRVPVTIQRKVTSAQPTCSAKARLLRSNARRCLRSQTPNEISSCIYISSTVFNAKSSASSRGIFCPSANADSNASLPRELRAWTSARTG
jgi:hypothetical protein